MEDVRLKCLRLLVFATWNMYICYLILLLQHQHRARKRRSRFVRDHLLSNRIPSRSRRLLITRKKHRFWVDPTSSSEWWNKFARGEVRFPYANIQTQVQLSVTNSSMFKMFLVISSLRFLDQFASSMNIFQNTNFKVSNLSLAVLVKAVRIKKECICPC